MNTMNQASNATIFRKSITLFSKVKYGLKCFNNFRQLYPNCIFNGIQQWFNKRDLISVDLTLLSIVGNK